MENKSQIDKSNFLTWKNDVVTKEIFEVIKEIREDINLKLTNADVLLGDNADKVISRLVGQREGLDILLEVSFEDLEESEYEED